MKGTSKPDTKQRLKNFSYSHFSSGHYFYLPGFDKIDKNLLVFHKVAKQVWALTEHITRDGKPKIVKNCSYPLTSSGCVKRIFTDLAIINVSDAGLTVIGMMDGLSLEELQAITEPTLALSPECYKLEAPQI